MHGHVIEILPFGILPVVFFLAYVLWFRASDSTEKHVASKIRGGIAEYPNDISILLNEFGQEEIAFTADGKSLVVSVKDARRRNIRDEASAREFLLDNIPHGHRDEIDAELLARHVISRVTLDAEQDEATIVITLPDDVVCSDSYIEREIQNVGRVFTRNLGNNVRWLQYPQGERRVERKGSRLIVHIDRSQIAPGFLDPKRITMSERQITRNIKNRLWNRVEVRCLSIDDKTYCGEIIVR